MLDPQPPQLADENATVARPQSKKQERKVVLNARRHGKSALAIRRPPELDELDKILWHHLAFHKRDETFFTYPTPMP